MQNNRARKFALIFSLLLITVALVLRVSYKTNQDFNVSSLSPTSAIPTPGPAGSAHVHASLIVFVNGERVDFSKKEYQLRDSLIHFEDGNGFVVHRHATGVTLPYLFDTLGIQLSENCIKLSKNGEANCNSVYGNLSIIVNDVLRNQDINYYIFNQGDRILISFGSESPVEIGLRANAIPELPEDL